MKTTTNTFRLGELITALYEEISKITSDERLQADLVYLALIDMHVLKPAKSL